MDKHKLDSLRKGSMVYFIAPNEPLQFHTGYVFKRATIYEESRFPDGKICRIRKTFLVITISKNPTPSDRRYLIEYIIRGESVVSEKFELSDVPESLVTELKEIKGVVLFNYDKVEFHIQWYKFLLRKLNLIEAYDSNYKSLASQLRDIVDTMRYCLMIIQESK